MRLQANVSFALDNLNEKMSIEKNKIVPFIAVAPGATIKAELEARNIKQKEFAKAIGMQATHLSELIKGKRAISPKVASDLERELGINAKFWMKLQAEYEYDCEVLGRTSHETGMYKFKNDESRKIH